MDAIEVMEQESPHTPPMLSERATPGHCQWDPAVAHIEPHVSYSITLGVGKDGVLDGASWMCVVEGTGNTPTHPVYCSQATYAARMLKPRAPRLVQPHASEAVSLTKPVRGGARRVSTPSRLRNESLPHRSVLSPSRLVPPEPPVDKNAAVAQPASPEPLCARCNRAWRCLLAAARTCACRRSYTMHDLTSAPQLRCRGVGSGSRSNIFEVCAGFCAITSGVKR